MVDCQKCNEEKKKVCSFVTAKWDFEGVDYKGCPFEQISSDVGEYLKIYSYWIQGLLPEIGTWRDQPSKIVEAMDMIKRELGEIEREEARAIKKRK